MFCRYDDYNWDWSLGFIGSSCIPSKLKAVVVKSPRVFHLGEWYVACWFCSMLILLLTRLNIFLAKLNSERKKIEQKVRSK